MLLAMTPNEKAEAVAESKSRPSTGGSAADWKSAGINPAAAGASSAPQAAPATAGTSSSSQAAASSARPLGQPHPVSPRQKVPQRGPRCRARVHGGTRPQHQRLQPGDQRLAGEAAAREGEVGRGRPVELAQPPHARAAELLRPIPGAPERRVELLPRRAALGHEALGTRHHRAMEYEDRRVISTPEGVQLALPLANIGSRFMALALDLVIQFTALVVVLLALAALAGDLPVAIVGSFAVLVFYIGYNVVFEVLGGGRTIGKRAAGLRVVSDGGAAVGLRRSLIRNILLLVEGLTLFYVPAMISVLASRNNQRLGDHAGGTLVVREAARHEVAGPAPASVEPERVATWDVTGVGDAEAGAVRSFLERRTELRPGARRALAAQLAGRLRPLVAGVRPGLDDETFLEYFAAAKARGKLRESDQ